MKLEINLADREEVAAGHTLLAVILQGLPQRSLFEEFKETQAADARVPLHVANAEPTAAEVFAAPLAPSTSPAPAPSTSAPLPPVATAPTTTTLGGASSAAPAASVELDSKGLPWDERIHASTKSKLASGEWKNKRGVPPERITAVEAELRASLGAAPAPLAPVAAAAPLPPVAPIATTPAPAAPVGASSPTTTTLPPAAPVVDPADFTQLMPRVSAAVAGGVLPATALNDACVANGLPSIVGLQQNPAYVPLVWAFLKQQYPALA